MHHARIYWSHSNRLHSNQIKSEHTITGSEGRGPVDYDILFHLFHIVVVCEAKNGRDVADGIPQNGAQLVASREVFQNAISKKRKRDEVEIAHRAG